MWTLGLSILSTVLLVVVIYQARRLARVQAAAELGREQARGLGERVARVERRRSELEAVLASMGEGVVAIDTEERLISLNRVAARLLSLDPQHAIGRPIHEVVRNAALQRLVAETLDADCHAPTADELTLRLSPGNSNDDLFLQVQASPIRETDGRHAGAVVVMQDVTRLRRLEKVRRDFVANVSHEIKTPISAITAAVETLIHDPDMPPAPRANFTGMIARQAERLDAIVEDLLSLTRLEQEGRVAATNLEPHPVRPSIAAACETCQANAQAKSITLAVQAPPLTARLVPSLLEQALINLIDNAVKYSPPHTTVHITARQRDRDLVIDVTDQGRGIEPEHLPRIFERFYRTDRARSRAVGGTGLGLSIVKHAAESLGGHASVQSQPGRGSTFTLTLTDAAPPINPARRDPQAIDNPSASDTPAHDEPSPVTPPPRPSPAAPTRPITTTNR